jgi:hypothetical protein
MKKIVFLVASFAMVSGVVVAGNATNDTAVLVSVGENPSGCGPVSGSKSGVIVVHFNGAQGRYRANVAVHDALPNTTYQVHIRCVDQIGTLSTNAQGVGTAQLEFSGSLITRGSPFAVDLYDPSGTKDTFIAGPFVL